MSLLPVNLLEKIRNNTAGNIIDIKYNTPCGFDDGIEDASETGSENEIEQNSADDEIIALCDALKTNPNIQVLNLNFWDNHFSYDYYSAAPDKAINSRMADALFELLEFNPSLVINGSSLCLVADEHFAFGATKNRLELAKKLVVLGANIDAHGINESAADVPIILSAKAGYLELLEFLIAAEADVNTSTYATALHLAANIEIAGALIIAGANIHAKTESGAIVRDLLSSSNKPDIVKLIDKTEILYHIIDGNLSYVDKLVEDLTLKEAKIFKAIFDNNFVGNVDGLSSISIMLYEFISRFIDDQTSVWAYDDLHQGEPALERAELDLTGNVENSCLIGIMDNAIEE